MQAEKLMIEKEENKEYLPMQGLDSFRKATVDLLLGAGNPAVTEARARSRTWCNNWPLLQQVAAVQMPCA